LFLALISTSFAESASPPTVAEKSLKNFLTFKQPQKLLLFFKKSIK